MAVKKIRRLLSLAYSSFLGTAICLPQAIAEPSLQLTWNCHPTSEAGWHCQQNKESTKLYAQVNNTDANTAQKKYHLATKTTPLRSHWDWVNKDQLPPGHMCKKGCAGAYIAPTPDWPEANKQPENALLHASADQSTTENNTTILSGGVRASQGYRHLKADKIVLNQNTNNLKASGHIELREPDLLIRATQISLNTQTHLGQFESADFLQHSTGTRGRAKTITRQSDTFMTLEDGGITQCTPDDELWYINASTISLDSQKGWGTAKQAQLEIKGIPVLYLPYITFPIDDRRKTGFLFPAFGSSGDNGFEVSTPYYLNIAPNVDATLSPRFISDRGILTELELRYLNRFGNWAVSGALLKDDDIFRGDDAPSNNNTNGNNNDNSNFVKHDRWLSGISHLGQIAKINTAIDYTKVSDNDYFKDLSINSLEVKRQTHLNQQATLSYHINQWQTQLTTQQYQTLDNDISEQYKLMPQFTAEYISTGESFSLEWIAKAEFTRFDHDESISQGGTFETGQRTFIEAGTRFPMLWAAGFITPTLKVRTVNYDMDEIIVGRNDTYSANTPLATLDMGLFFERNLNISNHRYTQTLEPRLFYFYSDYENQNNHPNFDTSELTFSYSQLYRDTRFSGPDRLDDANQISAGLTTRFINDNSGREVFSASIGQIFYFKDRETIINNPGNRLSNSLIASELQYQPIDKLWFSSTLLWNSRQDYLEEGGLSMQYHADNTTLLNVGYRFRRNGASNTGSGPRNLDQLDLSMALPVSKRWKIFSRFQYDIDEDRSVEDMFGIAYEDCCWKVRLVYQRGIEDEFIRQVTDNTGEPINQPVVERDHAFVLEFQLKGLGGIGNKAASILEESILGYIDNND